jgi:hypothetical protein
MNLVDHGTSAGHMLCIENRPEISDSGQQEQDDGDVLETIYVSGRNSLDQVRLTDEQPEELRRRAKAPS